MCISNNVEYLDKEQSYKYSTVKVMNLCDLCNAITKILDNCNISCNSYFKIVLYWFRSKQTSIAVDLCLAV